MFCCQVWPDHVCFQDVYVVRTCAAGNSKTESEMRLGQRWKAPHRQGRVCGPFSYTAGSVEAGFTSCKPTGFEFFSHASRRILRLCGSGNRFLHPSIVQQQVYSTWVYLSYCVSSSLQHKRADIELRNLDSLCRSRPTLMLDSSLRLRVTTVSL